MDKAMNVINKGKYRKNDTVKEMPEYPVIDMALTGRKIKRLMDLNGLSVKDIQHYLGLAVPQSIYHWIEGSSIPSIDNLYALSELFHVPIDNMIKGNRKYRNHTDTSNICDRVFLYYDKIRELKAG